MSRASRLLGEVDDATDLGEVPDLVFGVVKTAPTRTKKKPRATKKHDPVDKEALIKNFADGSHHRPWL